jgi:hypothetical protein
MCPAISVGKPFVYEPLAGQLRDLYDENLTNTEVTYRSCWSGGHNLQLDRV